ncbi:MAG: transposase, partial [Candidatus Sericytochromatia bacterium]|nr:transposase [Candidatus Sericytochromatia bacterium]
MKTSRFSEEQIIKAIKEAEMGRKVPDICRDLGVSEATFYAWRKKYGGMDVSQ